MPPIWGMVGLIAAINAFQILINKYLEVWSDARHPDQRQRLLDMITEYGNWI